MADSNIVTFEGDTAPAMTRPVHGAKTPVKPPMRSDLVEKASEIIPDPPVLINMVSKRVRQLNMGRPPLIRVTERLGQADIALMEIIEGKVALDESEEEES